MGKRIQVGDYIHGFSSDVPGYWKVISIRPFRVVALQQGKCWDIDVSRKE